MAQVKILQGVVINGTAYRDNQIVDLTGRDLEVALERGFAKVIQTEVIVTPPPKSGKPRKR